MTAPFSSPRRRSHKRLAAVPMRVSPAPPQGSMTLDELFDPKTDWREAVLRFSVDDSDERELLALANFQAAYRKLQSLQYPWNMPSLYFAVRLFTECSLNPPFPEAVQAMYDEYQGHLAGRVAGPYTHA